ncbi:hypothetical protein NQ318_005913 [Aromia moschata]|uniref:Uncharacterized protein n=1 Tax=Aromia moschata TaxID=1265417 RepID=A0AAV8XI11_9CUCU|nr:hypothetical protein NQ318_005913 [Aromia moschata]
MKTSQLNEKINANLCTTTTIMKTAKESTRTVRFLNVCKLSNDPGNVAPDLAILLRRDLERRP